ncbi:MAG: winged helix-turn-helix domain-containing protein [Parabacteroides johnsonii]
MKYKKQHVILSGQGLKLFTHLIESQQSVIAPQIIYSQVLGNDLKKEKIGKTERDTVSAAIVRLRESLRTMPFIQIKSCRGIGYQLIISNPEEV